MTCDEFTALLTDSLEGHPASETRVRCEAHRDVCRDCKAYVASYEATIRLARDALREMPVAPEAVVGALIERILKRTAFAD